MTQIYTPSGAPLTTDSINFTPSTASANTNSYNNFNFSGTNLGNYLLTAGKTYLLVTGNVTSAGSNPFTYGAAPTEAPGTTNLIRWNNTNTSGSSTSCTPAQCKTDTLITTNGGTSFSRNATTSSLIKLSGYQAVPAVPAPPAFDGRWPGLRLQPSHAPPHPGGHHSLVTPIDWKRQIAGLAKLSQLKSPLVGDTY